MKTNLLTFAATLLLAVSVNTASATYYLIGDFNVWNTNTKVAFDGNTKTIDNFSGGAFKIMDDNTWLGADNSGVYWLTTNNKSVTLVNKQGNGGDAANLYLPIASNYTFTITEENGKKTLSVSDLDDLLIVGSFYNDWAPQRMTKQSDGSYTFDVALDEGAKFKIRDFNNTFWGASSNTETHQIKHEWHTNISLVASGDGINSKDFEIVHGGNFRVVVKDGKLSLLGYTVEFDETLSCGSPSNYQNQVYNVQLEGRKFYCDGYWNTVCLPFNLDDFSGTIFNDADVMTLESSEFNAGTLTLNFNTANSISAGVPYIVRWRNGGDDITGPYFYDVTINSTVGQAGAGPATFVGCINPITIPEDGNENTDYLYLGANNTLYYPADEASVTIKAFRAYFKLNLPVGQQAKSFVLNFGDDNEVTSIKQINNTESATNTYFTLDGRRLNDKPATAGLYIINGKKVVIK